jgi:hypothetical protein
VNVTAPPPVIAPPPNVTPPEPEPNVTIPEPEPNITPNVTTPNATINETGNGEPETDGEEAPICPVGLVGLAALFAFIIKK